MRHILTEKTPFTVSEALGFGWAMTKEKFWLIFGLLIVSGAFSALPDLLDSFLDASWRKDLIQALALVAGFIIEASMIGVWLRFRDGQAVSFRHLFAKYPAAFSYCIATVLYILTFSIFPMLFLRFRFGDAPAAMLLLQNPGDLALFIALLFLGLYGAFRLFFYRYFVVEKVTGFAGIAESFKQSVAITKGRQILLFRLAMALFALNIPGALATVFLSEHISGELSLSLSLIISVLFAISLFVTAPIAFLALAFSYRALTKPPRAERESLSSDALSEKIEVLGEEKDMLKSPAEGIAE